MALKDWKETSTSFWKNHKKKLYIEIYGGYRKGNYTYVDCGDLGLKHVKTKNFINRRIANKFAKDYMRRH